MLYKYTNLVFLQFGLAFLELEDSPAFFDFLKKSVLYCCSILYNINKKKTVEISDNNKEEYKDKNKDNNNFLLISTVCIYFLFLLYISNIYTSRKLL